MSEQRQQSPYPEALPKQGDIPHIIDCPKVYEPDRFLIDVFNRGEYVSERDALLSYFVRQRAWDPTYMLQIDQILEIRAHQFPEFIGDMGERRLQFVIPAYRETGNITTLLNKLERQFDETGLGEWGVTFVLNHPIPSENPDETSTMLDMGREIEEFLQLHPNLRPYMDYFHFTRSAETSTPILPVALARKVGEDVVMSERLMYSTGNETPFYVGLMDCDLNNISAGVVKGILNALPTDQREKAKIIRVRGAFDRKALEEHPELHPLEMMWEGMTSETAHNSHNPFTVGRMSVIPARELATTGGTLAKKLDFPDEDIRHGEQIAWQIDGVSVVEVEGRYETSPRREIDTVRSLLAMLEENDGQFTMATLEYASLIRMYGRFAEENFRGDIEGQQKNRTNWEPLYNQEQFKQLVPPALIEASANARYRFGLFSKFVVDELANHPDAPEINVLKERFLRGRTPSFMNEFFAVDLIRQIEREDPDRFARLIPALAKADNKARQAIKRILNANHIKFTLEEDEAPIYTLEADMLGERTEKRDNTILRAPIHIDPDMSEYMAHIRYELGLPDLTPDSNPAVQLVTSRRRARLLATVPGLRRFFI